MGPSTRWPATGRPAALRQACRGAFLLALLRPDGQCAKTQAGHTHPGSASRVRRDGRHVAYQDRCRQPAVPVDHRFHRGCEARLWRPCCATAANAWLGAEAVRWSVPCGEPNGGWNGRWDSRLARDRLPRRRALYRRVMSRNAVSWYRDRLVVERAVIARDSFWRDRDPSAARPPAQSTRIQQLPGALLQTPLPFSDRLNLAESIPCRCHRATNLVRTKSSRP